MSTYNQFNIEQLNSELSEDRVRKLPDIESLRDANSPHFGIFYDTHADMYIKLYNKNVIWRRSGLIEHMLSKAPYRDRSESVNTEIEFIKNINPIEQVKKTKYDAADYVPEILLSKKYDILPDVIFNTKTYIATEWLMDGWRQLQYNDLVHDIYGSIIATETLKVIMKKLIELQNANLLDPLDVELRQILFNDYKKLANTGMNQKLAIGDTLDANFEFTDVNFKPCIGICGIDMDDFLINEITGRVIYNDMDNINIMPRLSNIIWLYEDDYIPNEQFNQVYDIDISKANIIYQGKRIEIDI